MSFYDRFRPRTNAERGLRDAARAVYRERIAKGATPAEAWARVDDVSCSLLTPIIMRDERAVVSA